VQLEDVVKKLVSDVDSCGGSGAGDKVCEFGKLVNKDCEGIEVAGCRRERADIIHSGDLPALRGNWKRLQESCGSIL